MANRTIIAREDMTQERLRELLDYNPVTGVFTWRVKRQGIRADRSAGNIIPGRGSKYLALKVCGKLYRCHRLAWLWMTGSWPSHQVDHIDGDSLNNRWANLRAATSSQNQANRKGHADSVTGFKGVVIKTGQKSGRKFIAKICVSRKIIHLGGYHTPEEAHKAYCAAADYHFGEFAKY